MRRHKNAQNSYLHIRSYQINRNRVQFESSRLICRYLRPKRNEI